MISNSKQAETSMMAPATPLLLLLLPVLQLICADASSYKEFIGMSCEAEIYLNPPGVSAGQRVASTNGVNTGTCTPDVAANCKAACDADPSCDAFYTKWSSSTVKWCWQCKCDGVREALPQSSGLTHSPTCEKGGAFANGGNSGSSYVYSYVLYATGSQNNICDSASTPAKTENPTTSSRLASSSATTGVFKIAAGTTDLSMTLDLTSDTGSGSAPLVSLSPKFAQDHLAVVASDSPYTSEVATLDFSADADAPTGFVVLTLSSTADCALNTYESGHFGSSGAYFWVNKKDSYICKLNYASLIAKTKRTQPDVKFAIPASATYTQTAIQWLPLRDKLLLFGSCKDLHKRPCSGLMSESGSFDHTTLRSGEYGSNNDWSMSFNSKCVEDADGKRIFCATGYRSDGSVFELVSSQGVAIPTSPLAHVKQARGVAWAGGGATHLYTQVGRVGRQPSPHPLLPILQRATHTTRSLKRRALAAFPYC